MKGFENIIGHDSIKNYLKKNLINNAISNAYIFSGSKGLGKSKIAEIYAKNIQNSYGDKIPECKIIDTDGKSIGVEEIREKLINDICIKPINTEHKIYIIPNAEKMTIQAQNALLKTLEEPPQYAVIILIVTDERKLLTTIRSRCISYHFDSLTLDQVVECLEVKKNLTNKDAFMIAKLTDCNIGQALRYADIFNRKDEWNKIIHLFLYLDDINSFEISAFVKELDRDSVDLFMQILLCLYRDMLHYKLSKDANAIILKDLNTVIMSKVNIMSYNNLYNSVNAIVKAKERIDANANINTVIEVLLLTIKENNNGFSSRS